MVVSEFPNPPSRTEHTLNILRFRSTRITEGGIDDDMMVRWDEPVDSEKGRTQSRAIKDKLPVYSFISSDKVFAVSALHSDGFLWDLTAQSIRPD
jgi:hypothetical protein